MILRILLFQNGPIYMKTRTRGDVLSPNPEMTAAPDLGLRGITVNTELQYNFIVSSALDIIEERVLASGSTAGFKPNPSVPGPSGGPSPQMVDGQSLATRDRELYLGALTAREEYKV